MAHVLEGVNHPFVPVVLLL